jgi:hypothetical protein
VPIVSIHPKKFKGYGENCWGLTASDTYNGYDAHSPTNDKGTITPTAALSSFPYTPEYSMKVIETFFYDLGIRSGVNTVLQMHLMKHKAGMVNHI